MKPTQMLIIGAPQLKEDPLAQPNRCRCNHASGAHLTLLGKRASGRFRTMAAKEYPGGMCSIVAMGVNDYLSRVLTPGGPQATAPDELHLFTDGRMRAAEADIGTDFAR